MPIPETLLRDLESIPVDQPVVLLMRHSNRFPIEDPAKPFEAALTEEGIQLAEQFGSILGCRFTPGRVMASPVGRCIDTAAAIARGAGWHHVEVVCHDLLSHPHIEPAWDLLKAGNVNGSIPEPVLASLELLLAVQKPLPLLDIMVTHDTVVGAMVGCLLKVPVEGSFWPAFLEGVFLWTDHAGTHALWRGEEHILQL